uniref:Uncharacterized protein n=1 Tax=Arundo donax TaxID=35708 RepID=A0A0A9FFH9_ARUDO
MEQPPLCFSSASL